MAQEQVVHQTLRKMQSSGLEIGQVFFHQIQTPLWFPLTGQGKIAKLQVFFFLPNKESELIESSLRLRALIQPPFLRSTMDIWSQTCRESESPWI